MQPFRRSIWDEEENSAYKTEYQKIDPNLIPIIDRIQKVEAAKKQVPPIPLANLIKIARLSENLPPSTEITVDRFEELLNKLRCYGAGIKTIIAIIAKLSEGEYPPIDGNTLAGLHKKKIITYEELKSCNGRSRSKVAHIYVNKILPEWKKERDKGRLPKEIDEEWARTDSI